VLPLFALTIFLSAALLFLVQPMFAKMLLPLLGGTPAVWNTSVVFFQIVLLAGYAYAHVAVRRLTPRWQAGVHAAVLVAPALALPVVVRAPGDPWSATPIAWLFAALALSVGLPFFAVSTSGPLLQRWFARTTHRASADPYFLYAASNAGSLGALVAYPFLVEPAIALSTQARVWTAGYAALVALTALCGYAAWRTSRAEIELDATARAEGHAVTWRERARWMALAAVPSMLMLSTNTYITTDIAAVPLLWIIPLALYLLTFILAFSPRQIVSPWVLSLAMPIVFIPSVLTVLREETAAMTVIPVHLATLFVAALACHSELARRRPSPEHLTDFYLSISAGGAVGGLFNTLVAPLVFRETTEYPLALVLACLLRTPVPIFRNASRTGKTAGTRAPSSRPRLKHAVTESLDVVAPVVIGVLLLFLHDRAVRQGINEFSLKGLAHVYALPFGLWLLTLARPFRLALGLAALFIAGEFIRPTGPNVLHTERTFFGIHEVFDAGWEVKLLNGTTNHGTQLKNPALRCRATSYYHSSGPIGQLFASFTGSYTKFDVGVVGLGAAVLAPYAHAGQRWTFYEINPAIERIARDRRYFTYLADCITDFQVVIGDARLRLDAAPDGAHDFIVLDAFSSDAIPVHLLTREAIGVYFRKLRPGGLVALHISNRYLDLEPVLAAVARDAGLVARIADDNDVSNQERMEGKLSSTWVVLARDEQDLGPIAGSSRWVPTTPRTDVNAWTDDFSDVVKLLDLSD
jgi:spermidine synthase